MRREKRSTWAVAEAKARLSEVLRRARAVGPQRVGTQQPCYVLSEDDFRALSSKQPSLGRWLVEEFSGAGDLPVPTRSGQERALPFSEEDVP